MMSESSFCVGRPIGAAAILAALCACSPANNDGAEAERIAILTRVPLGIPFKDVAAAMQANGFSCSSSRGQSGGVSDTAGRTAEHLWCEREQSQWLVCRKRTQALAMPLHGRLSELYVNVQLACL